jgi:hypothetical protein
VFSIILILLVVFAVLSLLLAAWTLFFQNYIYSEPIGALYWRAPAAAAALTAFLAIWVVCDYRSIDSRDESEGHYQPLHNFSAREIKTYKYLWLTTQDRKDELYELRGNRYLNKSNQPPKSRPLQIIAGDEPNGEKHAFKPQMDDKGHFKVEKDQPLRYYEDGDPKKRYMDENAIGQISIFHFGWMLGTLILNFGFLAVWFVVLWLLLRFQWAHALGLAFVIWIISLFVLPMILTQAEKVRKEHLPVKTPPATATIRGGMPQRFSAARFNRVRTAFQVGSGICT